MEKYRFDDAYGSVYKYDSNLKAYVFCGSYLYYGIFSNMTEKEKLQKIHSQNWLE